MMTQPSRLLSLLRLHGLLPVLLSTTVAVVMLHARLEWSGKMSFIFLVWNLFLAWVPYGLALLASLIAGVSVLAARDGIKDELLKDQNFRNTFDRGDIDTVVTFVGLGALFFALLALLGIVLAALVLRGRGWARIALIVLSVPTAVLGLIGFGAAFPLLWTLGAIAVIVLLSLGQVRQWFAMRGYEGRTA